MRIQQEHLIGPVAGKLTLASVLRISARGLGFGVCGVGFLLLGIVVLGVSEFSLGLWG